MTNLTNIKISYHFQNERTGRKEQIDNVINGNWGQVVKETYLTDSWKCLTDTGLVFVLTPNKDLIITYYFATMAIAHKFYNRGKVPTALEKRIQRNATKFNQLYGASIKYKKFEKQY